MKTKLLKEINDILDNPINNWKDGDLTNFYKTKYLPNYGLVNNTNKKIPFSHQYTASGVRTELIFESIFGLMKEEVIAISTTREFIKIADIMLIKLRKYD